MGVLEIEPGLYWSSIETDNGKTEIDLGCYADEGPAGVAHDLMAFKLNSSSGEQRRLPQVNEKNLVFSLSDYEKIARDIIKELKMSVGELAVALKSKGLAQQLHNIIENCGPPQQTAAPVAAAPAAAAAQPAVKSAVEARRKVLPPAMKRPKTTEEIPPPLAAAPAAETVNLIDDESDDDDDKPLKTISKIKKKAKTTEKKPKKTASKPVSEESHAEINRVWIKANPEFPLKSGKYPCYVKAKPLQHGYFTIAQGVVKTVLTDCVHGNIEMVSVEDRSVTWNANYTVKDVEHRVPGSFKGSRYFTQIAALRNGLGLKGGDVLYFMKGEEPQQVKIGHWPQGSAEAEVFTKELLKDQSGR